MYNGYSGASSLLGLAAIVMLSWRWQGGLGVGKSAAVPVPGDGSHAAVQLSLAPN